MPSKAGIAIVIQKVGPVSAALLMELKTLLEIPVSEAKQKLVPGCKLVDWELFTNTYAETARKLKKLSSC